jgi:hypothetical protein
MQAKVLDQYPEMPTVLLGVTKDNYQQTVSDLKAKFGETIFIKKGNGATELSPLQGIPKGKPVLILQKKPDTK